MEQRGSKRANRAPFVVHQQWPALSTTIHRSPTRQTFPLFFFATPDTDLIGGLRVITPDGSKSRLSWRILYYSQDSVILRLWIFVSFLFFKEIFIFIVFRRINWNTFRFIRSRRGFFSLSIDNRNIFQGERRGGGENLLGWRIVLFFFFFRHFVDEATEFWSIEEGSTLFGASIKNLSSSRKLMNAFEKLAKASIYKLVTKTIIDEITLSPQ